MQVEEQQPQAVNYFFLHGNICTNIRFMFCVQYNYSNVVPARAMNVVFKRIGFMIQKELAAQLVARLSFIHM
jgi:hypothetical protein